MTAGKTALILPKVFFCSPQKELNKCTLHCFHYTWGKKTPLKLRKTVLTSPHSFDFVQHDAYGIYPWMHFCSLTQKEEEDIPIYILIPSCWMGFFNVLGV